MHVHVYDLVMSWEKSAYKAMGTSLNTSQGNGACVTTLCVQLCMQLCLPAEGGWPESDLLHAHSHLPRKTGDRRTYFYKDSP